MNNILKVHQQIYDAFQRSRAGPAHFFLSENADAYAGYYTAMYLIQDTGESILTHMAKGFSQNPMSAYLEFWGVMQAIEIQQDAIFQLHRSVVGEPPTIGLQSGWAQLRATRHLCAGHPANRTHGVAAPQRTFMGRNFGNYSQIRYELWDATTGKTTHPVFDLRKMILDYDNEASVVLNNVARTMNSKWP